MDETNDAVDVGEIVREWPEFWMAEISRRDCSPLLYSTHCAQCV
jgi:hypothetical protein